MGVERDVTRYSAYYRGWCQAFGEHEALADEGQEVTWLLGDERVGVIVPPRLLRSLTHELQGERRDTPSLILAANHLQAGETRHPVPAYPPRAVELLGRLLRESPEVHLFLTYHLFYESGTRIITFSAKRPLPLLYKTLGPLHLSLL